MLSLNFHNSVLVIVSGLKGSLYIAHKYLNTDSVTPAVLPYIYADPEQVLNGASNFPSYVYLTSISYY